jgi:hypothetical protein
MTSVPPPAAKPTTISTGLSSGQAAIAALEAVRPSISIAIRTFLELELSIRSSRQKFPVVCRDLLDPKRLPSFSLTIDARP